MHCMHLFEAARLWANKCWNEALAGIPTSVGHRCVMLSCRSSVLCVVRRGDVDLDGQG